MIPDDPVSDAWRAHWARLLSLLVAQFRRFDLAEDSLQAAFVAAARSWPVSGVPTNPAGWLLTAARRRAIDRLRAEAIAERTAQRVIVDPETNRTASAVDPSEMLTDEAIADDRLALMFTCCHPALAPTDAAALTLRFVAGLHVREIARLFLVTQPTMAARLTRAKRKIVDKGIPFAVPAPERLDERLEVVLTVIYLIFTEGYSATAGPSALRLDLADEAVRLGHSLDTMLPGDPAVKSLLALMLLQHARRDTRVDANGLPVLLPDQDRSRWHHDEIAQAIELLDSPSAAGDGATRPASRLRLEALIAAAHATAPSADETDWPAIARYYEQLETVTGSPVVRLNRAVAVAQANGHEAALELLEGLDEPLARHHRLHAVRAELLARGGRRVEALQAFGRALELVGNDAERRLLLARRASVEAGGGV